MAPLLAPKAVFSIRKQYLVCVHPASTVEREDLVLSVQVKFMYGREGWEGGEGEVHQILPVQVKSMCGREG